MLEAISHSHPAVILGAGITGRSCARFFQRKQLPFILLDTNTDPTFNRELSESFGKSNIQLGEFSYSVLNSAGLIVKSPGIDREIDVIKQAAMNGIPVVSDLDIFIEYQSSKIVAITGSNGKSTVVDCLVSVLNKVDVNAVAAGNIGIPMLDVLEKHQPEVFVLELSSFQLESLSSLNADVASILNITEDHLDRHGTFENYVAAKHNIYCGARSIVFNQDDNDTFFRNDIEQPCELAASFGEHSLAQFKVTKNSEGFVISKGNNVLLRESESTLKGFHNGLNLAACIAVFELLDISFDEKVKQGFCQYSGLKHRCEIVVTTDGIDWVNDSKATNPGATAAAIKSLSDPLGQLFLIAGGDAKGGDIHSLIPTIEKYVAFSWVFGKDAEAFIEPLTNKCSKVANLDEAVSEAKKMSKKGDRVLLSPACASIDMYRNYQERGEHFVELVQGISE